MKFNRTKTSFGRHETFPLRYGWLTKGLGAIQRTPDLLTQAEPAMIALGVGRNMVNSLQYWLGVTGIVEFKEGIGAPTALGRPCWALRVTLIWKTKRRCGSSTG